MSDTDGEVASLPDERRIELGFTLRKLEELSGVSKSNVHKTLSGELTIQIGVLALLCKALGLTDWEVLREAHTRLNTPASSARVPLLPSHEEPSPEVFDRVIAHSKDQRNDYTEDQPN